jgi:hypothetical protein
LAPVFETNPYIAHYVNEGTAQRAGVNPMPVARYFLFVGGVLLALLFVIDALAPPQLAVASQASSVDRVTLRIRSDQKWPERVVYDTSLPTITPPAATIQAAAAPPPVVDALAQARVRNSFAQFAPAEAKKLELQAPRKRKIAKARPNPSVRLAQQSHFGFFGAPNWNSTW